MMARRGVIGLLGGGIAASLGGCGMLSDEYAYRYKMTVEVDTPQGLKTGFAVQEQLVSKSNVDLGELSGKRGMRIRGEAVAVDLPGGQVLFALLCDASLIQSVLDPAWKNDWAASAQRITGGDTPAGLLAMTPGKPKGRFDKLIGYPPLVRFGDIADPKTVEEVDPANLAASFGPGVRLRRITLQLTDEAVTSGIEGRLGWLAHLENYRMDKNNPFTSSLSPMIRELRSK